MYYSRYRTWWNAEIVIICWWYRKTRLRGQYNGTYWACRWIKTKGYKSRWGYDLCNLLSRDWHCSCARICWSSLSISSRQKSCWIPLHCPRSFRKVPLLRVSESRALDFSCGKLSLTFCLRKCCQCLSFLWSLCCEAITVSFR